MIPMDQRHRLAIYLIGREEVNFKVKWEVPLAKPVIDQEIVRRGSKISGILFEWR